MKLTKNLLDTFLCIQAVSFLCLGCTSESQKAKQDLDDKISTLAFVFDGGSSGTRISGYRVEYDSRSEKPPQVKEVQYKKYLQKLKGGIHTISSDKIGLYLRPLVETMNQISKDHDISLDSSSVKLYFMMTGGVRLLERNHQDKIRANIKKYFHSIDIENIDVDVLPGKLEGLYSWVNTNDYLGNFNHSFDRSKSILEIGGASVQYVTKLAEPEQYSQDDIVKLKIGTKKISLFSHSYEGYGMNSAYRKWFHKSCALPAKSSSKKRSKDNSRYLECRNSIFNSLLETEDTSFASVLDGVKRPSPEGLFISLGSINYTANDFGLNGRITAENIDARAFIFCEKNIADLQQITSAKEEFLSNACFDLAYLSVLLSGDGQELNYDSDFKGLGFSPSQALRVLNGPKGWSRGLVLLKTSPFLSIL